MMTVENGRNFVFVVNFRGLARELSRNPRAVLPVPPDLYFSRQGSRNILYYHLTNDLHQSTAEDYDHKNCVEMVILVSRVMEGAAMTTLEQLMEDVAVEVVSCLSEILLGNTIEQLDPSLEVLDDRLQVLIDHH
jgi:hypothetical protein